MRIQLKFIVHMEGKFVYYWNKCQISIEIRSEHSYIILSFKNESMQLKGKFIEYSSVS